GLGTWAEAVRRRGAISWGPGRWVWSALALYLLLLNAWDVAPFVARCRSSGLPFVDAVSFPLRYSNDKHLLKTIPWFLVALGFTRLVARPAPCSSPDARERAGLAFAALLVGYA